MLDLEAPPLHRARVLGARLIESMTPAMGVPSGVVSSPFEQYARVLSGHDFADSTTMARVFSHACNSLGIPARIVEMGRILSLGPDYDLFGAEDHAAVEVFDPVGNRWVWMDLAFGMLGVELQGYGALNASEMKKALNDAFDAGNLLAIVYDALSDLEARVPLAASPGAAGITALLQSNIDLRYSRRAP
jgi:transglutaminase-like putative cysteine protease